RAAILLDGRHILLEPERPSPDNNRRPSRRAGQAMIPKPDWTDADTQRALQFWDEYQKQNDVSALTGQAVGIEPHSGRVFFGDSASEIMLRREKEEGVWEPMFFLRVGSPYYQRKRRGGAR